MAMDERQKLCELIKQWNENRLDLFSLSQPDENLEFHGVMRFYFQEPGEKIATKCIRVSSSATTRAVIAALIEKFHPDMKMLSQPVYSIWEVHENGEERRLEPEERPLIVQLTWHKDDLEGRFVLKKEEPVLPNARPFNESSTENLRRSQQKRFSKREKKDLRKKYQQEQDNGQSEVYGTGTSAMSVYSELPQNTFTRTISNPEIVMKKRREKKLENKLKEMGHGGSLKIYGVELFPNRPYISLLVSVNDTAAKVLRDTLDKYGLEKENTQDYVLVEVTLSQAESALSRSLSDLKSVGQNQERCLADYERPLMDLLNRRDSANVVFLLRRRSAQIPPILPYSQSVYATRPTLPVDEEVDMYSNFQGSLRPSNSLSAIENTQSQRQNPNPMGQTSTSHTAINTPSGLTPPKPRHTMAVDPCLVPVNVAQHKNPQASQMISIQPGLSELGSEAAIQIRSNDQSVLPRHCAFMFRDGTVRVAPLHRSALVEVNGQPISSAVELKEGCYVRIGSQFIYRFHSSQDQFRRSNSLHQSHIGSSQQQLNQAGVSNATKFPDSLPLSQSYTAGVHDYPYEPNPVAQQAPLATHFDAVDDKISIVQQPSPSGSRKMVQSQFSRETPLPLVLEIVDQLAENDLLRYEIFGVHTGRFGFRLTPAFVLYMVSRHRLSPQFLPGVPGEDKIQIQRAFLNKFVDLCVDAVHVNSSNRETLVFWLANISELLHMLKTDHELNRLTSMHGDGIQDRFMDLVQKTFELFVDACRVELRTALHSFLGAATSNEHSVCDLLEDIVRQIRKFLLNSALTIQVFSQLFHFINMYIFNWLVTTQDGRSNMTRGFGLRLRHRLQLVLQWAERQGLEQACECHMDRINQTVNLLITPKSNDQIASLGATCYKLNSLQVRYLLESYITEEYEPRVSVELVDHVVYLASTQADMMAQQDGESVQLEESQHLMLPFLFPQDGYIVETLRGVPGELASYVTALQAKGLCRVIAQNDSNGFWTGHMSTEDSMPPSHNKSASLMSSSSIGTASSRTGGEAPPKMARQYHLIDGFGDANYALMNKSKSLNNGFGTEREQAQPVENGSQRRRPEIIRVVIRRAPNEGIGLSIVAAQAPGEPNPGIYVKKVIEGTPAHKDGRLHTGDQLLSVNNKSLVGITQEEAAQQMVSAGSEIHFEVAKQMAMINGLDTWLAKSMNEQNANPSLQMAKGQKSSQHPNGLSISDFGGQRVHGRSISASELYSQADTASLTSAGSAQPAPNVPPHQYAQPLPYQSQGRLPSHYKPTQRSAACVVQPGRPAASPINARRNGNASPTPLLTTTLGNGQQVTSCGNMPQRFRPAQQQRSASTVPFGSHYANPNHRMSFESAAELANLQRQRASASLLTDYSNLPLISQISNNIGNNGMGPQAIQAPLAGMETESLNSSGSGNSGGLPTQNSGLSDQAPTHLIGEGTPTSSNSSSARSSGSQKYTKQQPLSLDLRLYQTKFNDQSSILNGNNGVHPGSGIQNQVLPAYSTSSTSTSPLLPPPAVSTYFNGGSDWSRQGVKPLDTENGQFRNNTHRNGAGGSQRQRIFTPASTSQLPIGQVRVFQQPAPGSQQPKQFPVSGRRSAPLFGQEDPLRQVEQQASRAMTTDELNEELDRLDSKEVVTEADKQHYRKLLQELAERNGQESLGASKSSSDFRRVGMKSSRQTVSTSALDPDPNRPRQPTHPSMMMGRSNNGVALPYIGEMEFKLNRRAAQNPDFSTAPLKGHHLQQNSAENEIDDVSRVANRLNNMPIDEEAEENVETAQSNVIKSTLIYGQTATKAPVEKAPVSAMRDSSSPEDKAKKRVQFRDLDNLETDENIDSNRNGHHHIRLPSMEEVEESLDKDHAKNGNIGDESEQEPRVQIIGTNEVYKDPRQRRLDQQHQAKALRPVVDGSNLGFRDKMKLFATQLGEQTPKNKLKNSSVERDIELQINNGNNPGS